MPLPAENSGDLNRYFAGTYMELELSPPYAPEPRAAWYSIVEFGTPMNGKVAMQVITPEGRRMNLVMGDGTGVVQKRLWPDTGYYYLHHPMPQAIYLYKVPVHNSRKALHMDALGVFNPLGNIPRNFLEGLITQRNAVPIFKILENEKDHEGNTLAKVVRKLRGKGVSIPLHNREFCMTMSPLSEDESLSLWYRNACVAEYSYDEKALIVTNPEFTQEVIDNFNKECRVIC